MHAFVAVVYAAVGLLHLVPAVGVLGPGRLQSLYGLAPLDGDLLVTMRHRAALFGVIGVLMLAVAWRTGLRPVAGAVGLASMLSFVALAWPPPDFGTPLGRVFLADAIASVLLGAAWLPTLRAAGAGTSSRDRRAARTRP